MERKNTILLTVIAVATLLVAVVGATFAYFTASTSAGGSAQGETSAKTASMPQVSVNKETIAGTANTIYPGTMNGVGASISAQVTGEGATGKTYKISYTVTGKVELLDKEGTSPNDFDFPVEWELYESSTKTESAEIIECQDVQATPDDGNQVHYSQTCNVKSGLGSKVAEGKIVKTGSEESGDNLTKGNVATVTYSTGSINATEAQSTKYYYLVVKYASEEQDQNTDLNKTIKASLTDITVNSSEEVK